MVQLRKYQQFSEEFEDDSNYRSLSRSQKRSLTTQMVLIISNKEVANLLSMKECIRAIEDSFTEFGRGRAVASNRRDTHSPSAPKGVFYRFNTMEGIVNKLGVCAQRIDSERIKWQKVNGKLRQIEIPSEDNTFVGLVYLYSISDCKLLAILNDSEIQRMRVAGVCAVAAKHLARKDSAVLGLYGSGWQAEAQLLAMKEAFPRIDTVKVFSPQVKHRKAFAGKMSKLCPVRALPVDSPEEAAKDADIISAATNARSAVCKASWVSAGQHLTGIGGGDFDEECWAKSDLVYLSGRGFHEKYLMSDSRMRPNLKYDHMMGNSGVDGLLYQRFSKKIHYLPELLVRRSPRRTSETEISLFQKVGTTQGIEFASTAKVVYEKAVKMGVGKSVPDSWFVQKSPQ